MKPFLAEDMELFAWVNAGGCTMYYDKHLNGAMHPNSFFLLLILLDLGAVNGLCCSGGLLP